MLSHDQEKIDATDFWVCAECDLCVSKLEIPMHHEAYCPRCESLLQTHKPHTIERTLAFSTAGLILFLPANLFPILTIQAVGLSHSGTVFQSATALYQSQLYAVAGIVFLAAILIPLLKLLMIGYVSACLLFDKALPFVTESFKGYQQLDSWAMLEIYLLGILVSIIKLVDVAEVTIGIGLWSLSGLILTTLLMSTQMDHEHFWQAIDRLNRRKQP